MSIIYPPHIQQAVDLQKANEVAAREAIANYINNTEELLTKARKLIQTKKEYTGSASVPRHISQFYFLVVSVIKELEKSNDGLIDYKTPLIARGKWKPYYSISPLILEEP